MLPLSTTMDPTSCEKPAHLGIGAISRAVGIPPETLRTWERRYGFPTPERRPSGHRRYRTSDVPRLKRITVLLARGVRAGDALTANEEEAKLLLRASATAIEDLGAPVTTASLLAAVRRFDANGLTRQLQSAWARLGPIEFAADCIPPLLYAVGEGWASGALNVRHEHFLSERLSDVLPTLRLPLEAHADGPLVVLASLPGEEHDLGLQLASLVAVASGLQTVNGGTQLSEREIAALAHDARALAVGISVSAANSGAPTSRRLGRLRTQLPRRVKLIAGGAGAPKRRSGIETLAGLRDLETWAKRLVGRGR